MGRRCARAWTASLLLVAAGAFAQTGNSPQPDADPLRGPKVDDAGNAGKPSLVERGFDGSMTRLDERPETAALKQLTLSEAERAGVDKVLAERAGRVQSVLREHMALFLEVQGARQGGDREAMRRLMPQFREAAADLLTPPLRERLAAVLTPENAGELNRTVDEYVRQMQAEGERRDARTPAGDASAPGTPTARPDRARPGRSGERVETNLTIREIARSLSAIVAERRERTETLLKAVNATPEQEARIQAILREGSTPGQPPSERARAERMRKILGELTPEQRRAWVAASRAE